MNINKSSFQLFTGMGALFLATYANAAETFSCKISGHFGQEWAEVSTSLHGRPNSSGVVFDREPFRLPGLNGAIFLTHTHQDGQAQTTLVVDVEGVVKDRTQKTPLGSHGEGEFVQVSIEGYELQEYEPTVNSVGISCRLGDTDWL
jgi:hypothetical protein